MSDTNDVGETFARLWRSNRDAEQFAEAKAAVMANEMEDLRALGVNVDDRDALAAARADDDLMARHAGRQIRAIMDRLPRTHSMFSTVGLADRLTRAIERQEQAA